MNRDLQFLIQHRLGLGRTEDLDIPWRTNLLYELARSIVIPMDEVNINSSVFQSGHFLIEKQRRFETFKTRIVEITRNDDKVHFLSNCRIQYLLECTSSRVPDLIHRSARILS
jgi:glycogen synthase